MPDPTNDLLLKELKEGGPASGELCKQLGIDFNDVLHAVGKERPQQPPHIEAAVDEIVRTKEAAIIAVATYLSNRPAEWWGKKTLERQLEVQMVIDAVVTTYKRVKDV